MFLHERRPLGVNVLDGMQVRTNPQFSLQAATNSLWAMAVLASAHNSTAMGLVQHLYGHENDYLLEIQLHQTFQVRTVNNKIRGNRCLLCGLHVSSVKAPFSVLALVTEQPDCNQHLLAASKHEGAHVSCLIQCSVSL